MKGLDKGLSQLVLVANEEFYCFIAFATRYKVWCCVGWYYVVGALQCNACTINGIIYHLPKFWLIKNPIQKN